MANGNDTHSDRWEWKYLASFQLYLTSYSGSINDRSQKHRYRQWAHSPWRLHEYDPVGKVKITSVKRGLVCSIKSTYGTLEYVVQLSNETAWAQHVLDSNTSYIVTWRSLLRSCESFKFSLNCQHISCRTFTMEESFVPISRFIGIECGVRQIAPESIGKVYLPGITNHLLHERQITNFGNICN